MTNLLNVRVEYESSYWIIGLLDYWIIGLLVLVVGFSPDAFAADEMDATCAGDKIADAVKKVVKTKYGNRAVSRAQSPKGVKAALESEMIVPRDTIRGNAIDYVNILPKHGFVLPPSRDVAKAPPGAIIVFKGSKSDEYLKTKKMRRPYGIWVGDITIKGGDGFYYADARKGNAAIGWRGGKNIAYTRNVAGIFLPGPKLLERYEGKCNPNIVVERNGQDADGAKGEVDVNAQ